MNSERPIATLPALVVGFAIATATACFPANAAEPVHPPYHYEQVAQRGNLSHPELAGCLAYYTALQYSGRSTEISAELKLAMRMTMCAPYAPALQHGDIHNPHQCVGEKGRAYLEAMTMDRWSGNAKMYGMLSCYPIYKPDS